MERPPLLKPKKLRGKVERPATWKDGDKPVVELMLDSGVFSAWNRGAVLDINDYIKFLKVHKHLLYSYVNMDKIPGEFGKPRTSAEVEDSARQSYQNQQHLKGEGLTPIPVFHQGERFYWLEKYLADGEPYIGLSTAKDIWTPEQVRWLDAVWGTYLSDKQGRPKVKTHGFGITKPQLLYNYPWFTVDSTTWSLSPGYGQILCPVYKKGKPDYTRPPFKVVMSGVEHESASSQRRQFENMGSYTQECVLAYLEEVGVTPTEVRYNSTFRRRVMLYYYRHLCEALYDVRYQGGKGTLVGADHYDTRDWPHIGPWNLRMHFATAMNPEWSSVMTEMGSNYRLLNYYDLKKRKFRDIEEYIMTGKQGEYVRKSPKQNWSEAYTSWRRLALFGRINEYATRKEDDE